MKKHKFESIAPRKLAGYSAYYVLSFVSAIIGNRRWVSAPRLRAGAIIIALTAGPQIRAVAQKTCYKPATPRDDRFSFETKSYGSDGYLELDKKKTTDLTGNLTGSTDSIYKYKVYNADGEVIQEGEVDPKDGKFDGYSEGFVINFSRLPDGEYSFKIFLHTNTSLPLGTWRLRVKNSPKIINTCYY
ncbi:MAG: hypothetical protein KKA07_18685 [Bacteroidetes bacterium]|nr:hypothetical protein [Bacteroidota bacterium]MBU1721099.1 hypothetical protein [Bacteroidota bacterium]